MVHFIDQTEVTPGTTGSFQLVDLSAYVSASATGVILQCDNSTSGNGYYGAICNGSSSTRTNFFALNCPYTFVHIIIKCDADKKVQLYASGANIHFYIIGYTEDEVVLYEDPIDISMSTINAWTDVDMSAGVVGGDTPLMAIVEYNLTTGFGSSALGFRDDGSTDNRTQVCYGGHLHTFVVGVTSNIFEGYIGSVTQDFYLVGYFKSGVTKITNATDESLSSTGLADLPVAIGTGHVGGFFEMVASSGGKTGTLQANDNIPDTVFVTLVNNKTFAIVPCDADGIFEGNVSDTIVDFFLLGTIEAVTSGQPIHKRYGGTPHARDQMPYRVW